MPRGKSANGASKGVGGSREFSGADCRRVAAVIRATLVAVDGCCCCWGGGGGLVDTQVCKGTYLTVHLRTESGLTVPFPNFLSSALYFLLLF